LPVVFGSYLKRRLAACLNKVPRRIFGPRAEDITGSWRKLHNKELHNLYVLPNIIRVMKPSTRCAEHVTRKGDEKWVQHFDLKKLKQRDHLGDLGVDDRII
jgi:hypothetical protein